MPLIGPNDKALIMYTCSGFDTRTSISIHFHLIYIFYRELSFEFSCMAIENLIVKFCYHVLLFCPGVIFFQHMRIPVDEDEEKPFSSAIAQSTKFLL